jgi:hypothetical protein
VWATVHHLRQAGLVLAGLGQQELDVVIKAVAAKTRQIGPGQRDAHKAGADHFARLQLQVVRGKHVAHTLHAQGGVGDG